MHFVILYTKNSILCTEYKYYLQYNEPEIQA